MAEAKDGLFLLEVLVDKIVFEKSPCFPDKEFRTCVNVQAANMESLEICDDDGITCAKSGSPFVKNFNNGKSCLFSMPNAEISSAMSKFPVNITVYKSLPCGCLPTKIIMGTATIDMTKEFAAARQKYLEDPTVVSYQALKDAFQIVGPDNAVAGTVTMFLRITCFGKLIVTRFQGAGSPPTLGSGGGTRIMDHSCNPPREFQTRQDPCVCGAAKAFASSGGGGGGAGGGAVSHDPSCPAAGGGGAGVCGPAQDPYNSMPCMDPDDLCYCCGPRPPPKQSMACRNTDQYCLHVPKGRTKQFEEIGTNLCGNELKIKVPASASIIKKISQTHCSMMSPYTPGKNDKGPCESPCGKNQISMELPSEAICCRGAQLQATQFTCTTEGCTQASKHGQQAIMARGEKPNAALVNKDVFVLKVAKTALEGDRKCKLELELVTPKAGDKKPSISKTTRRMQCDPDCDCNRLKKPPKNKRPCTPCCH